MTSPSLLPQHNNRTAPNCELQNANKPLKMPAGSFKINNGIFQDIIDQAVGVHHCIFLLPYIHIAWVSPCLYPLFSNYSHIHAMIILHDAHMCSSHIESIEVTEGYLCTLRGESIVVLERLKFSHY